jgi:threonine/homoserine/homoserine lactone efflux protein
MYERADKTRGLQSRLHDGVSRVTLTTSILALMGALTLGAMSPGPSFVLVARMAVAASRRDALAAAVGMGCGGVLFAAAAILGLQAILAAVPWVYVAIKVLGGAYLIYLGWQIWRAARNPLMMDPNVDARTSDQLGRSFLLALTTQVSNPKTAVVYGSIFAALLPSAISFQLGILLCVIVFTIETAWYAIVAIALSSSRPRAAYLGSKPVIDRVAGSVMALLGTKLVTSSFQS